MKTLSGSSALHVRVRSRPITGLACCLFLAMLAATPAAQVDADFTATPTSGPNTLTVSFTDTTSGDPVNTWIWTFGDGAVAYYQHPMHTYDTPGTYSVSLIVITETTFDVEIKDDLNSATNAGEPA